MEKRFVLMLFLIFFIQSFFLVSCYYLEDVNIISTCEELQQIKYNLNGNYLVLNEIDCSGTINWNGGKGFEPLGNFSSPFLGSFIGLANISNLHISRPLEDYVGLFGNIYLNVNNGNLLVDNLSKIVVNLVDVNITGRNYVGAVAGYISNEMYIIVDHKYPLVRGYSSGIVSGYGNNTGGIAGSIFQDVAFEGGSSAIVRGVDIDNSVLMYNFGGLFGSFGGQVINNSYFTGQVICEGSSYWDNCLYMGGLVGYAYASKNINGNILAKPIIMNSYAEANILKGIRGVGGLVGLAKAISINKSYFKGNLNGVDYVGGLVGFATYLKMGTYHYLDSYLYNSYCHSNLGGGIYTHPLIGKLEKYLSSPVIINSYSTGNRLSSFSPLPQNYFSGLVGSISDFYSSQNSYWDYESFDIDLDNPYSFGRNTSDMVYPYSENTYLNWNFDNVWAHDVDGNVNNGYPYLKLENTFFSTPFLDYFYCGDTICSSFFGENCSSCSQDCFCQSNEICNLEGICIPGDSPPPEENLILRWKNPSGQLITSSSYSCSLESNTCNMILEVSGIKDKEVGDSCNIELYEKRTLLSNLNIQNLTSTIKQGGICNATWDFFTQSTTPGFTKKYYFKYEDKTSNDLTLIVNNTIIVVNIASCGDYKTENSCEDDDQNVAKYSVGNRTSLCGKQIGNILYDCYCSWNESNSICQGTFTSFEFSDEDPIPSSLGSCSYEYEETDDTCEDGFLLNEIKTSFVWAEGKDLTLPEYLECLAENGTEIIIPCSSSIKIPFFSYLQIFLVLGLVFLFYKNFNSQYP
jgi:hypothetical protein